MIGKFDTPGRAIAETVRMLPVLGPFLLLIALSVRSQKLIQYC